MKIGTRVEVNYKGELQKLLVTEETTKAEIDSFYESLKKKEAPKKKPVKKSK